MYASLIIPSYNACERLYYNLLSLNYQDCGFDNFEVIVIDNGSIDNTFEVLSNIDTNYKLKIIRSDKNMGRAFARNAGIKKSEGDILIFHDSDMIASSDYVGKHLYYQKHKAKVVCGSSWIRVYTYYYKSIKNAFNSKTNMSLCKLKYGKRIHKLKDKYPLITEDEIINGDYKKYVFSLKDKAEEFDGILRKYGENLNDYYFPWRFFVTNNCSAWKDDVLKTGCFDENFIGWGCEDLELGYRMYKKGCSFIVKKDIISVHQEHPRIIENGSRNNIFYFTHKYDNIDVLLLYFGSYISIDKQEFNDIMKEIKNIEEAFPSNIVPLLFNKMLIRIRDCTEKGRSIKEKWNMKKNNMSIEGFGINLILKDLNTLRIFGTLKTVHALNILLKAIYAITL